MIKKRTKRKDKYCKGGERRAKGFASRKGHKREALGYCKTERKQGGGACLNHSQEEQIIPFKHKREKKDPPCPSKADLDFIGHRHERREP